MALRSRQKSVQGLFWGGKLETVPRSLNPDTSSGYEIKCTRKTNGTVNEKKNKNGTFSATGSMPHSSHWPASLKLYPPLKSWLFRGQENKNSLGKTAFTALRLIGQICACVCSAKCLSLQSESRLSRTTSESSRLITTPDRLQ